MTDCPPTSLINLMAEVERLQTELTTARETNGRLNRRCQVAERAASERVTASTGSLGRGLANYAASMYARESTELKSQLTDLIDWVAEARDKTDVQGRSESDPDMIAILAAMSAAYESVLAKAEALAYPPDPDIKTEAEDV